MIVKTSRCSCDLRNFRMPKVGHRLRVCSFLSWSAFEGGKYGFVLVSLLFLSGATG